MNRSLLSAFDERNGAFVASVRERLKWFCADRSLHARFLNMLSLLEHIGSRKIMKSPAMTEADSDILRHLAEETRHALFFKRAAERMAQCPLDYSQESMVAHAGASFYMGRLDAEIAKGLGNAAPALPYLYMSLMVELRAVWIYRLYHTVLMEQKIALSLKSVLAEEELHLRAMLEHLLNLDPQAESRIALFSDFERRRFKILWSGIERECEQLRVAAA